MTPTGDVFTVGTARCPRGERAFGHVVAAYLEDASEVRLPVILVHGAREGPTLYLGAAMHGIEIAGAEVIRRLTRQLIDPRDLRGRIVAVPIQNPLAMREHSMLTPKDGQNINRLFPGGPADTITGRLAEVLFRDVVLRADYVIDIHSNTPPTLCWVTLHTHDGDPVGDKAAELAEVFGITIIQPGPGATWGQVGQERGMLCDKAGEQGKPSFILELTAFTFEEAAIRTGVRGLLNVMRHLGMIEGTVEPQTDVPVIRERLAKVRPLRATRGGFVHHLAQVGDRVAAGQPVAAIVDPWGDEVERVVSPVDGYVVTYPRMLGNQAAATGDLVVMVAPPK
jgi:predicted deacylase